MTSIINDAAARTVLHVTIRVAPSDAHLFLKAFEIVATHVINEPESILINLYENKSTPGLFRIVEEWVATTDWLREVR